MNDHIIPPSLYIKVWAALLLMLGGTIALAYVPMGWFNTFVAVTIAFAKAILIVLFFMHVRYKGKLIRVFVCAGLFWLGILFALTLGDYFTRSWLPQPTVWIPR
jgi:cytochrome c oxidase subunit IV